MNRKNSNLAFFTLFIVVLLSSLTLITFAQKTNIPNTEQSQPKCTGEKFVMPSSISLGNIAFADYLKVASLPAKERQIAFSALSNEQKASFIRVNLALQFIKRPNMTKEQQEFLLDAILKVSADLYDTSDAEKVRSSEQRGLEMVNRALGLFTHQDASDFIEPLGTNKNEEVTLLQKYEDLLKNGMKARKKIVREMPVNDRVNIWKTQLVYHLTTANLSQPQRELIVEFLMTLSPATFIRPVNETKEEAAKALEILEKKILSVFSRAEEFAIFEELGIQKGYVECSGVVEKIISDKKETNKLSASQGVSQAKFGNFQNADFSNVDLAFPSKLGFTKKFLARQYKFCDCLYYCGCGLECGFDWCNVEVQACGPFGTWWCTKRCGVPLPE